MSIDVRPLIDQSNLRVIRVFEKAYSDIEKNLSKSLSYKYNPEFNVISLYLIYRFLDRKFEELNNNIQSTISEESDYLYYLGFGLGLMSLYDSIGGNYTAKSIVAEASDMVDRQVTLRIKNATMRDLLQVTRNTEYAVRNLVQATMAKHLNVKNMQNMGRDDLAKQLVKELQGQALKKGIREEMIAIVDKAGRRWKVDNYIKMVARTKAQEVVVTGMKDYVKMNNGNGDLARIPFNPLTNDPCLNFQGLIISMTGATAGYRTYDELKATRLIFHPNCRHTPVPYYSFGDIPAERLKKHEEMVKKSDKAIKRGL